MGPGRLVFKGENPKKKKKKSKHTHKEDGAADSVSSSTKVAQLASPTTQSSLVQEPPPSKPSSSSVVVAPKRGTGHITTSGTVVTGHGGTQFEREISPGDAIIVVINEKQEMRVVTMRLSNVSLNLSSPFSHNIKEPTAFSIIRKPRDETKLRKLAAQQHQLSQKEEEEKASGTFGSTDELVYREKTEHGSYRIKRVKVGDSGQQVSRADLLHMRAKKTSDKYC